MQAVILTFRKNILPPSVEKKDLLFCPIDGDFRTLRNVDKDVPDYTVSHPRRQNVQIKAALQTLCSIEIWTNKEIVFTWEFCFEGFHWYGLLLSQRDLRMFPCFQLWLWDIIHFCKWICKASWIIYTSSKGNLSEGETFFSAWSSNSLRRLSFRPKFVLSFVLALPLLAFLEACKSLSMSQLSGSVLCSVQLALCSFSHTQSLSIVCGPEEPV